jgi:hypothetical protein
VANELRVRQNFLGGIIEDNPLASGGTTLTSAALAAMVAIGSTQHMPLTLDPDGIFGEPEIVYVTAHTAAATTATILRAQEGTTARSHQQDVNWVHGPAAATDFIENPVRAGRAHRTTTQSIPDNTWTTVVFPTVDYDLYGMINTANGRFTPGRTGLFLCSASVTLATNATGRRGLAVAVNGTILNSFVRNTTTGGYDHYGTVAYPVKLTNATDYIEFQYYQDSGVALNTGSTDSSANANVVFLGGV